MTRKSTDAALDAMPLFADPRYDSYVVPRSKTPEKQRFYDWLLDNGWNFDNRICEWHAPESGPENNWSVKGRLCTSADHSEAWIQPPCFRETSRENPGPGPILRLLYREDGTGPVAVRPQGAR